jgi:hypothetical protein
MNSTATIFGSFPSPAAQPATAPAASPAVAVMFDSFGRDGAPRAEPADAGSAVSAFVVRIRQAFDRWTESNAQSRADALMWDMARSDPRIMAELQHARMRDDSETLGEPAAVLAVPGAPVLEAVSTVRHPSQRTAGQGWGRIIEDAYQNRFPPRQQHA